MAFIARLPSLISGYHPVEVAHIRYAEPASGKDHTGGAQKPDGKWTVPLSAHLHRLGPDAQHHSNERGWWAGHGIDPIKVAAALYAVTGNYEAGCAIIRQANNGEFQ
jgi:hypothetical protein